MRWSITTLLTWGLSILVLIALASTLYLGLRSGLRNTQELVADKAVLIVSSVTQRAVEHLAPAKAQVHFLGELITSGKLDLSDHDALARVLEASLAAAPQIAAVNFFYPDARVVGARREPNGQLTRRSEDAHGRTRLEGAFEEMRRVRGGHWGEVV